MIYTARQRDEILSTANFSRTRKRVGREQVTTEELIQTWKLDRDKNILYTKRKEKRTKHE